jgi:hypothetical protein
MSTLLLLASSLAFAADEQLLRFGLSVDGTPAGSREIRVRYLPPDPELGGFETRIVESVMKIDAPMGASRWTHTHRCNGRSTDAGSSFTCAVKENGASREVQGRRNKDLTWTVTVVDAKGRTSRDLRSSEVSLSSMDLLDPTAYLRLLDQPEAALLSAESGVVLRGPVRDLGESTLQIAGQTLPVRRLGFSAESTTSTFSYGLDGLLLAYEMVAAGHTVRATLTQPPPARDFGDVMVIPFGGEGTSVTETPL